jgi:SHS2 domain-containing protein
MAVMGRKKQGVANLIAYRRSKVRDEVNKLKEKAKEKEEEITPEEHERRIKALKEMGILKE